MPVKATTREMIFGSSEASSGLPTEIRRQSFRLKRLEGNTTRRYRKGIPVPRPTRPTSLAVSELRYVEPQNIVRTTPSINGRTMTQLALTFSRPADQRDWHSAKIYVKGYRGNVNYVQMGTASQSPAILLLENTGETISIAFSSQNIVGQNQELNKLKTLAVTL